MTPDIAIYDTTLRDGTQREGISLSVEDKLRIARRLDAFGVSYIEGGWPGSNPKDEAFFRRALAHRWEHATLCAFGATRRARSRAEDDPSVRALLASEAPVCTIFGKASTMQVTTILQTGLEENLAMVRETVAHLVDAGRRVFFDAEHFFDGYAANAAYALAVVSTAAEAGAEVVVLCDTNGGTMPWDVGDAVEAVRAELTKGGLAHVSVGIHAHDDGGLAVANSLAAVRAGATHVQGTVNGYGERCGNANLCIVIPDLVLKMKHSALHRASLEELSEVSRYVAEVANLAPDDHMPYVGRSAFAHKGGVHVSAMRRSEDSYQHVAPEQVGNQSRVLVSELSGRANLLSKAEAAGLVVEGNAAADVVESVKEAESRGYCFEAAEASVELMLRRREPGYAPPFRLIDYKVLSGAGDHEGRSSAEAVVKVAIGDVVVHTAAEGDGPVQALDTALRKALVASYPEVAQIELIDYKVRILDGRDGTAAVTRVLIDSADGGEHWSTVGASGNIIEASCRALLDGIEHGLARRAASSTATPAVVTTGAPAGATAGAPAGATVAGSPS